MSKTTTIEVPTEWVKMTAGGGYDAELAAEVDIVCQDAVKAMRPPDSEPIDAHEELTRAKDLLLAAINTPEIRKSMGEGIGGWLNRVRDSNGDVRPISLPPRRRCELAPRGWFCTRTHGHEPPCAAVKMGTPVLHPESMPDTWGPSDWVKCFCVNPQLAHDPTCPVTIATGGPHERGAVARVSVGLRAGLEKIIEVEECEGIVNISELQELLEVSAETPPLICEICGEPVGEVIGGSLCQKHLDQYRKFGEQVKR